MKQSTLNNIERIVTYMEKIGWTEKVDLLSPIDKERLTYCEALSKAFLDLAVEGINLAEAKYLGYAALVENKDKPETLDAILKKHAQIIGEAEAKRKDVEDRISELIFMLDEYRERVLELGNLPQTVPVNANPENASKKECA